MRSVKHFKISIDISQKLRFVYTTFLLAEYYNNYTPYKKKQVDELINRPMLSSKTLTCYR